MRSILERFFGLREAGTTPGRELVAVGRWREVHPVMYCLAVFFAAFFLTSLVFK